MKMLTDEQFELISKLIAETDASNIDVHNGGLNINLVEVIQQRIEQYQEILDFLKS